MWLTWLKPELIEAERDSPVDVADEDEDDDDDEAHKSAGFLVSVLVPVGLLFD